MEKELEKKGESGVEEGRESRERVGYS